MRRIILFFLIIILFGCDERSKGGFITLNSLIEYHNEYDTDSLLINTVAISSLIDQGQKYKNYVERYAYTYEKGELIREEIFWSGFAEVMELRYIINYRPSVKEEISVEKNDTTSCHLCQFDEEGRIVYEIKKQHLSYPHYGIDIDDNFEEWSTYDSNGELVKKVFLNNYNGEKRETYYFNDELPSGLSGENVIFIHYLTEQRGDTSVIKRYCNSELEETSRTLEIGNSVYEWIFDREHNLIRADETIVRGDEEIFITYDLEIDGVDSLYYKNSRMVRSVSIEPETRSVEVFHYDQAGNKLLEEKVLSFLP